MGKRLGILGSLLVVAFLALPPAFRMAFPRPDRPLEGVALEACTYSEASFRNEEQQIELAGMLFLPESDGPTPAVVMIHGAGNSRRDNRWYLSMASYFQANGIAVLLPDKRGCESSEGSWRGASFENMATDTEAAIDFMRSYEPRTFSRVGILGCSQGGQIVPIVAAGDRKPDFAINLVGSVVPFHEALYFEENNNLREMGLLPGVSHGIARLSSIYIRKVAQPEFWNAIGNYDPLPYWEKVSCPALAVFGEVDTNTDSARSAHRLESLGKPNIRTKIFPGSGHPVEDSPGQGDAVIRIEALELMRDVIVGSSS